MKSLTTYYVRLFIKYDGVSIHAPFSLYTNKLEGPTFTKLDYIFNLPQYSLWMIFKGPKICMVTTLGPHSLLSPSGGFYSQMCIICVPSKGHRFSTWPLKCHPEVKFVVAFGEYPLIYHCEEICKDPRLQNEVGLAGLLDFTTRSHKLCRCRASSTFLPSKLKIAYFQDPNPDS